jgi:hypothetical protein
LEQIADHLRKAGTLSIAPSPHGAGFAVDQRRRARDALARRALNVVVVVLMACVIVAAKPLSRATAEAFR